MLKIDNIYPEHILTCYNNGFIDYRPVCKDGVVGSAKPLYEDTARLIFKHLNKTHHEHVFKGIIPKELKHIDQDKGLKIAWIVKTHKRKILYSEQKSKPKYTDVYALPNLVFKLNRNKISVIACKNFRMETPAAVAPFTNGTSNGVCMGSARIQPNNFKYIEDVISHCEEQFFGSYFSHLNEVNKYILQGRGKDKYDPEWLEEVEGTAIQNFILND